MRDLFGALRRRRGNNEAEVRPSLHPLVMGDRQEVLQPLHVGPRPGDLPSPADADGVVKMAAPQPPSSPSSKCTTQNTHMLEGAEAVYRTAGTPRSRSLCLVKEALSTYDTIMKMMQMIEATDKFIVKLVN